MHKLSRLKIALAAAGLLLATGGALYASIPGPSGTLSGCYDNKTGALRIIDSSAKCKVGETAVAWNQTGPQGPQGPRGPSTAYHFQNITDTFTVDPVLGTEIPILTLPPGPGGAPATYVVTAKFTAQGPDVNFLNGELGVVGGEYAIDASSVGPLSWPGYATPALESVVTVSGPNAKQILLRVNFGGANGGGWLHAYNISATAIAVDSLVQQ